MSVYTTTRQRILDIIAVAAVIGMMVFGAFSVALAHEGHTVTNAQYQLQLQRNRAMGRIQAGGSSADIYLYGMNRMDPDLNVINCCLLTGMGDCKIVPLEGVRVVPGGYEWQGEFIPEREATISPDDNYYGCKHNGSVKAHCFFAPPQGF